MHVIRKDFTVLVLSLAVVALAACGGSGSDGSSGSAATAGASPSTTVATDNKLAVPRTSRADNSASSPAETHAGGGSDAAVSSSDASQTVAVAAQGADTVLEWTAQPYTGGSVVRANGKCYVANWWAGPNDKPPVTPPTETGSQPWELASCSTAGATDVAGSSAGTDTASGTSTATTETPVDWTKWTSGAKASGTINFHLLVGASNAQDQLVLDGGRYTDLIMSNMIAGVLFGHLTNEYFPGIPYNKDYLYGSILGQLLQENQSTQLYDPRKDLLAPSPDQAGVMGVGQGGPYQINFYAAEMVAGGYKPAGHSLINYIAVQKNIGYSMAEAGEQFGKATPPSFNNKYYGPVLTSYFHYNDLVALAEIGKGEGGWATPWQPDFDNAMKNFVKLPNNFLDVVANVAYNQGFYGELLSRYAKLGATATAETVKTVNSYASVWGKSDGYEQYPYQVRYYLDQLYNNPIPTTDPNTTVVPQNQVEFPMPMLRTVFGKVFHTLATLPQGATKSEFIPEERATTAFDSALAEHKQGADAVLDLSKSADRAIIFGILEDAITKLEAANGTKFNATTNEQL